MNDLVEIFKRMTREDLRRYLRRLKEGWRVLA